MVLPKVQHRPETLYRTCEVKKVNGLARISELTQALQGHSGKYKPRFWPSQRVSKHTLLRPAPSLPALFLSTIKKLPPQPASFYTPSRNSDFGARGKRLAPEPPRATRSQPESIRRTVPKEPLFPTFFPPGSMSTLWVEPLVRDFINH